MRSESDPRSRIAWQPETPMSKALWEKGSVHEAIISTTGSRLSEGRPIGMRARESLSGIVSILGMLLEPGEPAQASFGGHYRGRTSPRSRGEPVIPQVPRVAQSFGRRHRRSQVGFRPRSRFASEFAESGPGPVPLYGCRAIGMARMSTRSAGHRGSIAWRGASPFMAGSPVAWLRLAAGRRLPGEPRAWRRPPVADTIPEPMRVSAGRGGRCA
jgi:hypothetical protein